MDEMGKHDVVLVTTKGELFKFIQSADITIVGLDRNIFEPASQGSPILYFEGVWWNNGWMRYLLTEQGAAAAVKENPDEFRDQITSILENPESHILKTQEAVQHYHKKVMPADMLYAKLLIAATAMNVLKEIYAGASLGEEEAYQYLDSVADREEPVYALYRYSDFLLLEPDQIEEIQKFAMQNKKTLKVVVYGVDDPQAWGTVSRIEFTKDMPDDLMSRIEDRDFLSLSTPAIEAREDFAGLKRQPLFFRYQSKDAGLLGMGLIRVQSGQNIGLDFQDGYLVIIDEILQGIVQKYLADLVFKIAA